MIAMMLLLPYHLLLIKSTLGFVIIILPSILLKLNFFFLALSNNVLSFLATLFPSPTALYLALILFATSESSLIENYLFLSTSLSFLNPATLLSAKYVNFVLYLITILLFFLLIHSF